MRIEPIGAFELVPFEAWHFDGLETGAIEEKSLEGQSPAIDAWVGNALTAMKDGRPIAIAGLAVDESGIAQAWFLGSNEVRRDPITLHRAVSTYLPQIANTLGLNVVECDVHETLLTGQTWAERLGFQRVSQRGAWMRYRKTCRQSKKPI